MTLEVELGGILLLGKIKFDAEEAKYIFSEPSGSANTISG